jgi:hypothetical protein
VADAATPQDAAVIAPQATDAALDPDGPAARGARRVLAAARRESLCHASDHEACLAATITDCNAALDAHDGDYDACTELLGWGLQFGVPKERLLALRCIADRRLCPAKAACEKADASACVLYGRIEMAWFPGSRDFKVITAAYRKACTLKSAAGCRWLAFLSERGPEGMSDAIEANVPFDLKEARRLYKQACAWSDKAACDATAAIEKACVNGGLHPERHECFWIAAGEGDVLEYP